MSIGDSVKVVYEDSIRHGMKGIITQIYPPGLYAPFAIYHVTFNPGQAGQFTEEQLQKEVEE